MTATPQLDLPLTLSVGETEIAALSAGARASCRRSLATQTGVQEASTRAVMEALTDHFRELRAAGVRLVAGSDAPTDCTSYGPALIRTISFMPIWVCPIGKHWPAPPSMPRNWPGRRTPAWFARRTSRSVAARSKSSGGFGRFARCSRSHAPGSVGRIWPSGMIRKILLSGPVVASVSR